jgi:hypothetical protein
MRGFALMIAAGVAVVVSSLPADARGATHRHRSVTSHLGATARIGGPYGPRGSGDAGAILRQYDAGAHAGSGWYQPGWGGTLSPGWGYSFGPRLGGSGL